MSAFVGTWVDGNNDVITISATSTTLLSLSYSNGRGPFTGYAFTLAAPVIDALFGDDGNREYTGVLSSDGSTIYWNNGTQWKTTS